MKRVILPFLLIPILVSSCTTSNPTVSYTVIDRSNPDYCLTINGEYKCFNRATCQHNWDRTIAGENPELAIKAIMEKESYTPGSISEALKVCLTKGWKPE